MDKQILEQLTNVKLTSSFELPKEEEILCINGLELKVFSDETLVVGSGAAGLRACVELLAKRVSVSAITSILFGGTSACSGSDKQTIFTCSTSANGDNVKAVAEAIRAGGCMDADMAYVEAVNSYLALDGLRMCGLDLPTDKYGTVLRYKTDHDESGRATSCGPRTSRLMVKVLAQRASALGLKLLDRASAIAIIKNSLKSDEAVGIVGICQNLVTENNPYGLFIFKTRALILAGGGAGDLYRDSVYPYKCTGTVGLALEAGMSVSNIQEQQFGIGTPRRTFPWNLSGTYMQVIPDVYSVDNEGSEHHFLDAYYENTKQLCSNIFRKGYQWPIHALRTLNYGSSLFDLAVFLEIKKGRKVYLDFRRNYQALDPNDKFSLDNLDDDVKKYLSSSGSLQDSPYLRLECMNALAIELYKMHGYDLEKDPLEFTINHQHFNGGLSIDINAKTSFSNVYAIGECAGSHGVTRPGGAALNSGQVFAIRAANSIALNLKKTTASTSDVYDFNLAVSKVQGFLERCNRQESLDFNEFKAKVQEILSDYCGFICNKEGIAYAKEVLKQLQNALEEQGLRNFTSFEDVLLWRTLIYEARAIASSMDFYLKQGGGSRGARIVCDKNSSLKPVAKAVDLSEFSLLEERAADKDWIITSKFEDGDFKTSQRAVRQDLDINNSSFEAQWNEFLTKNYQ